METRQKTLLIVAVLLGGIYLCFFTDWFRTQHIQIMVQGRFNPGQQRRPNAPPVSFLLDGRYSLTEIQVTPLESTGPGGKPAPVWDLVAISNAPVVEAFVYGQRLPGFRPAISNAPPQPLAPGGKYRLRVRAGRATGQTDFKIPGTPPPGT